MTKIRMIRVGDRGTIKIKERVRVTKVRVIRVVDRIKVRVRVRVRITPLESHSSRSLCCRLL